MFRPARAALLALACALPAPWTVAAGGHFEVDDAAIVNEGRCQVEVWKIHAARNTGGDSPHIGPACRVGAFELGLNLDHRHDQTGVVRTAGPSVKWVVDPLVSRLSAGLAYAVAFDLRPGGKPIHSMIVPLTLFPSERLQVHANVGGDWGGGVPSTKRVGVGAEWSPNDRFTLMAERILRLQDGISRVGARWMVNDDLGLDLSVARSSATGARIVTLGFNQEFAKP